jgi:hypothetical protein
MDLEISLKLEILNWQIESSKKGGGGGGREGGGG